MDATVPISPPAGRPDARAASSITAPGAPAQAAGAGRGMVVRLTAPEVCIGCGVCVDTCPRSSLGLDDVPTVDEGLCTGCGRCVEVRPAGAQALVMV
jgi:ferredoxin